MEWALMAAVLAAVGVIAGLLAGLLGVGGGIVLVPAFYYVFSSLGYPPDHLMHVGVATSLATIIFTSGRSVRTHDAKGAVDWALLKAWAPWIVVSAAAGALLADRLKTPALMAIFGGLAFFMSLQMAFGDPARRLGERPPEGAARAAWASVTGFFSALMGIGGGVFGVTIMSLYGVPMHRAVGTAAGFGAIIAVPSVIVYLVTGLDAAARPPLSLGYVNLAAFALITPLTAVFAPIGARLAHRMDVKSLKRVFAIFLAVMSLNMLRKALMAGF